MKRVEDKKEFDEEPLKRLLSLTKNMPIEPKRNELCYCMSGKKYKKCCVDKEEQSVPEYIALKELQLVPDTAREVFQYDMCDEDYHIAVECYELLLTGGFEDDPEAKELLDSLLEKYPTHPALNTVQALRHLIKGEDMAFEKAMSKNIKNFPDSNFVYLLSKYHEFQAYAIQFFSKLGKQVEKAPPVGSAFSNVYDKKRVPLTEFILTLSLQIFEALFQENLHKAIHLSEMVVDILKKMEWEDHFLLARVEQLLVVAKFTRRIKILLANNLEKEVNLHGTVSVNS